MFNSKKEVEERDDLDWDLEPDADVMKPDADLEVNNDVLSHAVEGCILSAGTVLTGDLEADDNIVLEGRMTGNMKGTGRIRIGGTLTGNCEGVSINIDHGTVTGDVTCVDSLAVEAGSIVTGNCQAASAHISGTVNGNMKIAGKLILAPSSVINGDVEAELMSMAEGCKICGHFKIG